MKKRVLRFIRRVTGTADAQAKLDMLINRQYYSDLQNRLAIGRVEKALHSRNTPKNLQEMEFSVFSQWGEDGIIQYIVDRLGSHIPNYFVEFGVESYQEANTRFLLHNNYWSGLVLDGSEENIKSVRSSYDIWARRLKAECRFITKDNINTIFRECGVPKEIGILSIDIDGNDYWVWKEIATTRAALVICEYNARFGPNKAVTIPYNESFIRRDAHYSNIYFGASLEALRRLGEKQGYALVGCTSEGLNAFFVRKDLLKIIGLPSLSSIEAFRPILVQESMNEKGELAHLTPDQEQEILSKLPLVEVK